MVVTTKFNHIKFTEMRVKKMLSELVDVPRMEEDREGLLRGGFVMLNAAVGRGATNGNCSCNTGDCTGNENCDCNSPYCSHNDNCTCNCQTKAPEPTDPPKEPVSPMIAGFGMFF